MAPKALQASSLEQRLAAYYNRYNPAKLHDREMFLDSVEKFKLREGELSYALKQVWARLFLKNIISFVLLFSTHNAYLISFPQKYGHALEGVQPQQPNGN